MSSEIRSSKPLNLRIAGRLKMRLMLFFVCGTIVAFAVTSNAAQLTLAWDPDKDPSVAGYRVYEGAQSRNYTESFDTGDSTTCTVTGLENGQTYYFAVTARDTSGLESDYSNEVAVTIPTDQTTSARDGTSTTGGNGGGGCFIATAAFGSYIDPHVMTLRAFRDTFLMTNKLGLCFVSWYYATSPAIAEVIRRSELLKAGARVMLLPPIGFSSLCLTIGFFPTLALVLASIAIASQGVRSSWTAFRITMRRRNAPNEERTESLPR